MELKRLVGLFPDLRLNTNALERTSKVFTFTEFSVCFMPATFLNHEDLHWGIAFQNSGCLVSVESNTSPTNSVPTLCVGNGLFSKNGS